MQRQVFVLVLVLAACALLPLTQPPQPRALTLPELQPEHEPKLTLTLTPDAAVLSNDGTTPCRYRAVGYGELRPQDAEFTYLVDGQPARNLGRCGTGLVSGVIELPPGGRVECPVYYAHFQPREVAVQLSVEVNGAQLVLTSNAVKVTP